MTQAFTLHIRGKILAAAVAAAVLLPSMVMADGADSGPNASEPVAKIQVEALVEPSPSKIKMPIYPTAEVQRSGEGWVQLAMMIDPTGKAFEVTVEASSGNKVFEQTAVRAAEATTYNPGMLNGQPIESATKLKFTFRFEDQPSSGAGREFVYSFERLQKAIKAKNRMAADAAMKDLEVRNLYEDAFYGLALYFYAHEWGDEPQQLAGLRRAIAYEKQAHYLPNGQFQAALVQCLALEVKLHHYTEAQDIWLSLHKSGVDAHTIEMLKPNMDQLEHLRYADGSYDVSGAMPDGTWELGLYKRRFQIKVSEGHISYVKLRCAKGFVRFEFDPTIEYTLNPKFGSCEMQLDGDPGTRFTLTQF
jgi:TonB family protein